MRLLPAIAFLLTSLQAVAQSMPGMNPGMNMPSDKAPKAAREPYLTQSQPAAFDTR